MSPTNDIVEKSIEGTVPKTAQEALADRWVGLGCLIFQYLRSLVSPATISLPRCLAVDSCGMTVRRHHILIDSNHHSVIDKAKLQDTLGIWLPAPLSYFMQMNILFSNAWLSRYVTKHCSLLSQYAMTFAGVSCATGYAVWKKPAQGMHMMILAGAAGSMLDLTYGFASACKTEVDEWQRQPWSWLTWIVFLNKMYNTITVNHWTTDKFIVIIT